jgi:hypothetical protein
VGDPDNPTADAFYHADDAAGTSRNTAGIYLILPDFRGKFVRGLDPLGVIDQDGPTRTMADDQVDAFQNHNHVVGDVPSNKYQLSGVFGNTGGSPNVSVIGLAGTMASATEEASAVEIGENINAGFTNIVGIGRVRLETRPYNVAVDWGIWY